MGGDVMDRGRPGKQIMCINDGLLFDSITEAATFYKISRNTITKQLTGVRGRASGKYFVYIDDSMALSDLQQFRRERLAEIYGIKNI